MIEPRATGTGRNVIIHTPTTFMIPTSSGALLDAYEMVDKGEEIDLGGFYVLLLTAIIQAAGGRSAGCLCLAD